MNTGFKFASDWITASERPKLGRSIPFAQGTPALLAWRLIILMGAKALAEENFDLLHMILTEPIEVEESGGQFSNVPFPMRRDLFYPKALLGYANIGLAYITDVWKTQPHIHDFFDSEDEYHRWVAEFLMIVAIVDSNQLQDEELLYPGYRLIPEAPRAMAALGSRLASNKDYRRLVTSTLRMDPTNIDKLWPPLATRLNSARLGGRNPVRNRLRFPDQIERAL